jgi:S-adenosylmethionine/arginine decarboxylase-like enzyme
MAFFHKHLIVNAKVQRPVESEVVLVDWFRKLVEVIDMKILIEPSAKYCDTLGNEGVTGTVVIETSHASIHIWSKAPEPYVRMDVYSCKYFNEDDVIRHLDETMGIFDGGWMVVDRNSNACLVTSSGFLGSAGNKISG